MISETAREASVSFQRKSTPRSAIRMSGATREMSAAQYAGRILDAWNHADYGQFEAELEQAAARCQIEHPLSVLEDERRELLESVVINLRLLRSENGDWQIQRMKAPMDLLRHLRHVGTR